ncbi:MAG: lipid-A-disaccharide synthase [Draconibacterium sp.]|nr:MAG: lipid-A-disaccharide synthase [Draconibacterium sp.]
MKYYLIAGEASGDLHGSNLMKALKMKDPEARFRFFGGDMMQLVGGTLVKHYREMAFMGIVNVLVNLKKIARNLQLCKDDIVDFQPDVVILIDYPGFNLRIAEFAQTRQLKVFYYISPKIWAWKTDRVKKIKRNVDEMFTIFPFETKFYARYGMKVHYVGNPLLDAISQFRNRALSEGAFRKSIGAVERPVVALLAGSRVQEVKRTLPLMAKIAATFPSFQFVVAGVKTIDENLYKELLKDSNINLIFDQTYDLLNNAHAALVASGTAALETALFHVPQAVIYKIEGGWFTDLIVRNFVLKTIGVALPNIIMNEMIVPEFIQQKMTFKNVKEEMEKLLFDETYRNSMRSDYQRLDAQMGQPGCSDRAASIMVEILERC